MPSPKRFIPVIAALGLVASGLLTSSGAAAPAAATPTCETVVVGVLPSGKLLYRSIHNTHLVADKKTAAPLPFKVDYLYGSGSDQVTGGRIGHLLAHTAGRPAKEIDVKNLDAAPNLTVSVVGRYHPSVTGRLFADSGRFYTYGVDPGGRLMRWSRFIDGAGHLWFANPKVVKKSMGSLKTLSYEFTARPGGVRKDFLYGTTKTGALKQFQIPWGTPAQAKVTTLKTSGFAAYTSLSLAWCNDSGTIASIIAIDKVHNQARWYTLGSQFSPKGSNVVRRPLVAPGSDWRLHATY